jgi:hypothetical protein
VLRGCRCEPALSRSPKITKKKQKKNSKKEKYIHDRVVDAVPFSYCEKEEEEEKKRRNDFSLQIYLFFFLLLLFLFDAINQSG